MLHQPGSSPKAVWVRRAVLTSASRVHETQVTFGREQGGNCDTELTSSLRTDSGVWGECYILVNVGKPDPKSAG